jgi:hypothetical protein
MDLSKLTDADLQALKVGDLSRVSDAGLMVLKGGSPAEAQLAYSPASDKFLENLAPAAGAGMTSVMRGLGGVNIPEQLQRASPHLMGISQALKAIGSVPGRLGLPTTKEEADKMDAPLNAAPGGTTGRVLGAATLSAPLAFVPGANTYLGAAGIGALSGAATTEGDASERAKAAALGGLGGTLGTASARGLARLVSPAASTNPKLQLLKDEGVSPTIGQTLGGRWNAAEEKLTSLPLMGDAISMARNRSLEQFNKAALNRATKPVGGTIEETGHAGVAKAGGLLSDAYDAAANRVPSVKFDDTFEANVSELKGMSKSLVPSMRAKFNDTLKDVVGGRTTQAGAMLPETFKKVDSEIGYMAAKYGRSTVASEQELGDAFKQLQALLREQATRTSPAYGDALGAANKGYANLVRVEGAAKAAKNNSGVFTPAQLNAAVQQADNSVRKRAVSQGGALMQDLADAGQSVIGNKVPNSFTADRAWLGGGAMAAGLLNPAIPAGLVGGAAIYTPQVQTLLRGLLSSRPDLAPALSKMIEKSSPALLPGLLGYQLSQTGQ